MHTEELHMDIRYEYMLMIIAHSSPERRVTSLLLRRLGWMDPPPSTTTQTAHADCANGLE